ncbi:MAG: glycosyltransferase family 2 protein [Parcubacteria group bacterium]|nr:glycosyltransferase family 2 protein [Parcubacteria group bacterium]
MKLSIIVPVYNEASTIKEVVGRIQKSSLDYEKEIIIVDDGSKDGTDKVIQGIKDKNVKKNFHSKNLGKGAAIRTACKSIEGDIVIIQDADLEYDPRDYGKLIKPILEDKADVVYGSRFVGSEEHRVLYFWHMVGNKFLTLLSNMATNMNLTDMETGYKVFRKEIIGKINIKENRFGFEPEITAKLVKLKCRIYEVGISYSGRTYAQGKKIGWKDGVRTMWCILKYNLLSR